MELEWRLKVFPSFSIFVLKFTASRYALLYLNYEIYVVHVIDREWSKSINFPLRTCIFPTSSSETAFWKHSQARSSFSIIFEGTCWEGWDVAVIVVLGEKVLDRVVSIGVDESTSYILTNGWDGGRLGLTVWDNPCLAFLPSQLGRFPKSRLFSKGFLLSPANGRAWDWVSGQLSSPITSFSLFSFVVDIHKAKNNNNKWWIIYRSRNMTGCSNDH